MNKINPELDIVLDILKATQVAYPASKFIASLLFQYQERGGLSKKQLEGLHEKASKVPSIPIARLATLQAIILKKPTRYRSAKPELTDLILKDEKTERLMNGILEKYPAHKRILFLKLRFDNKEILTVQEKADIERLHKLLLK